MPTLVVHHLERSRSHRILWLLEELEVPYELREYRRDPNTMRGPASLRAVHPLGKSPVVSIDGKTYAESGAIIEELLDAVGGAKADALRPSSPEARSRYRFFMHYAEGSLMSPLLVHLITGQLRGDKIPLLIRPVARGIAKKIHANFTKQAVPTRADIRQSYDQVLREGTPQALSGFIKRFRDQTQAKFYVHRARKRLKSLKQTQPTTTSSSSGSDSGLTKRQAYLDFLKAKGTNTVAALRRFIHKHSRTPEAKNYIQRARRQLRRLQ